MSDKKIVLLACAAAVSCHQKAPHIPEAGFFVHMPGTGIVLGRICQKCIGLRIDSLLKPVCKSTESLRCISATCKVPVSHHEIQTVGVPLL